MVDTGANVTCIDPEILQRLRLSPRGIASLYTPSSGNQGHQANEYDVSLALVHPKLTMTFNAIPVVESELAVQGIQGLIGRDLLSRCLLVYDGAAGRFTIAF